MKKTLLASLGVMLAVASQAAPVAIAFTDLNRSFITLPTGLSALPVGSVVRVGNFNDTRANVDTFVSGLTAGGLTDTELSTLNTSFQTWQTFTIGAVGNFTPGFTTTNVAGRFGPNFNSVEAAGFNNEDLYFAFYNVSSTNSINSATAFGLFRGISQLMPNDDGSPVTLGFTSAAIEAVGSAGLYVQNANAGGTAGSVFTAGSNREFRMIDVVPIPEPATAASLLLGGGLLVARRRTRRA